MSSFRCGSATRNGGQSRRCGDRSMPARLKWMRIPVPAAVGALTAQLHGPLGKLGPEGTDARTSTELTDCYMDAASSRTQSGKGHSSHESVAPRETILLGARTYHSRRILHLNRQVSNLCAIANQRGAAAQIKGPCGMGRVCVGASLINAGTERSPPDRGRDPPSSFGATTARTRDRLAEARWRGPWSRPNGTSRAGDPRRTRG